jgi:hypothetical protein
MKDATALRARARRRAAALKEARRDPRYRRVIGRFVAAGLLTTTGDVPPQRAAITVDDALWAGRIEPRILELLPAAIIKRPSLFKSTRDLPNDLDAVVRALRKNLEPSAFRGLPGAALLRWLPVIGHKDKVPSRLKSFRLQVDDLDLLERLSNALGATQTEVLRRGLRRLASTHLISERERP